MPRKTCSNCKLVKTGVKLCADDLLCPECEYDNANKSAKGGQTKAQSKLPALADVQEPLAAVAEPTNHSSSSSSNAKINRPKQTDSKKLTSNEACVITPDTIKKSKSIRSATARAASAASAPLPVEQLNETIEAAPPAISTSDVESPTIVPATTSHSTATLKMPATDISAGADNRTGFRIVINELLAYATFYRDKCTGADLHKVIVNFYLPSEINESKTILLNEYSIHLTDCPFRTARRQSNTRSAHDAEVEDILGVLEFLDNLNSLDSVNFAAATLDRLPRYGPNDINICAVVDKQLQLDKQLSNMNNTLEEKLIQNQVETREAIVNKFKEITGQLQESLNEFSSKCISAVKSLSSQAGIDREVSVTQVDRSMNVVLSGIDENRDAAVWRNVVMQALDKAAGTRVEVIDAFRLGRFVNGRSRPILIKLNSVWNRRLILAGARKLRDTQELRRVFITADEPPDVRRLNTWNRLKGKAERDGKNVIVSEDGVLSIDGVDIFCKRRGFVTATLNSSMNHNGGQH